MHEKSESSCSNGSHPRTREACMEDFHWAVASVRSLKSIPSIFLHKQKFSTKLLSRLMDFHIGDAVCGLRGWGHSIERRWQWNYTNNNRPKEEAKWINGRHEKLLEVSSTLPSPKYFHHHSLYPPASFASPNHRHEICTAFCARSLLLCFEDITLNYSCCWCYFFFAPPVSSTASLLVHT